MKSNLLAAIVSLFVLLEISVKGAVHDTTFWRNQADFIALDTFSTIKEGACVLVDNHLIVYSRDGRLTTRHRIIHILNSEGLDNVNKVVVYIPEDCKITDIRARSINSDGEVKELNQKNIKDLTNYSEDADLKIFAIEGAEVGGQIEFIYSVQAPLYDGGVEQMSDDYPTIHGFIAVCGLDDVQMDARAYNFKAEETNEGSQFSFVFDNVAPLKDESYTTREANVPSVIYRVSGLGPNYKTIFSSYEQFVKLRWATLNDFNANDKRPMGKYVRQMNLEKGMSEEEKIIRFAGFMKENFFYVDDYSPEKSEVQHIMRKKLGNDLGLIKLYHLFLLEMNIEHQILVTCDKYSFRFDPDFCSRYFLEEYLIYFPEYRTYLYASSPVTHYGIVPPWLEGNTALIMDPGNFKAKFRLLETSSPEHDQTNLQIHVKLDLNAGDAVFDISGFGTGQVAYDYNAEAYFSESEDEKQESFLSDITWRYPDCEIEYARMIHPELWGDISSCEDYECKREFEARVRSHSFYEQVGDKLIINVGKLIGPQNEMYSEEARRQPITCDHNKSYAYKISVEIPDGYHFSGSQNVEIDNKFVGRTGRGGGFKSTVETSGNAVIINIYEYYGMINMALEYYEDYRTIINSAANFNKATLLFEKNS